MTLRELNRTYLARQLLLERSSLDLVIATERLIGLQAQLPRPPFIALWSRIRGLVREDLAALVRSGQLIRATMMRGTIHLVSRRDFLRFRQTIQPVLSAQVGSLVGDKLRNTSRIVEAARACLARRPQTFADCRAELAELFPDVDERAMGFLARMEIPLVMAPDESTWAHSDSLFVEAESWLGEKVDCESREDELVLRYLAAFGPATAKDAQAWSGLQNLKSAFERLRPRLKALTFGRREYLDLPDAPEVSEDAPAPPRLLAPFDSAILGHHDRSRILSDEYRKRIATRNLQVPGTILLDGFIAGTWSVRANRSAAVLTIAAFERIPRSARAELMAEAEALARFLHPEAKKHEVVLEAV